MQPSCSETLDPRIRRTRGMLQQALEKLLQQKDFENISVQDIAEAATVNRATFYDHYSDKFALLECLVATQFQALLTARGVQFDGGCGSALRAMVLGVCDYLATRPQLTCERQLQMEPHLEAAVIAVVRGMLLFGIEKHPPANGTSPAILAATLSWAIFGAAKEWSRNPEACSSEVMADQVMALVLPIFASTHDPLPA
ncbi:MAG: TetR/AcrR family transcriptional regulator [Acidobacteriota bacterium]